MRVSHPRSKGQSRRKQIRNRWKKVRTKIPVTLEELNFKLDDDEGRKFFKMVCPYVLYGRVLMLVCVCPYALRVYPYDNMCVSL